MHVAHLSLVDYRSYESLELDLRPGTTTFVGLNGQGKTNLVEAIGYVATLGSHRVSGDAPLVRQGAPRAVVRAELVRGGRRALVELEITPGKANRARLNRNPVRRTRDVLGVLRTVLFAPEDLALVKGDPTERRRYLDELLVTRWPRVAGVRADYDRVLRQRGALLKSAGGAMRSGRADTHTLDVWDEHLAASGSELLSARLALLGTCGNRPPRRTAPSARGRATWSWATAPPSRCSPRGSRRRPAARCRARRSCGRRCSRRWPSSARPSSTAGCASSARTATTSC